MVCTRISPYGNQVDVKSPLVLVFHSLHRLLGRVGPSLKIRIA